MGGFDPLTPSYLIALIALGGLAGAVIGSFIAALCLRWPAGVSVLSGRSRCDGCQRPLRWFELVPLVSAAWLRGRCRTCQNPIDPWHRRIEAAAMLIGAGALAWRPGLDGAALALLGWSLLPLAVLDARHFWLPDALVAWLAAAGLMVGGYVSGSPLGDRLIGGIAGGAILGLIAWGYKRWRGIDGLGGGDPKLVAALGCWLGWAMLPPLLLTACLIGIGWVVWLRLVGPGRQALPAPVTASNQRPIAAPQMVPFGTLLALATGPVILFWPMLLSGGS